jgi:Ca2+-binding EF-hand superfamily protein
MITIAEFQDMLGGKNVSQQKWADALRKADANNDGAIDFAEFKDIFKKMIQESRQGI